MRNCTFGDLPCWAACENARCNWNMDGQCRDNSPCEEMGKEV